MRGTVVAERFVVEEALLTRAGHTAFSGQDRLTGERVRITVFAGSRAVRRTLAGAWATLDNPALARVLHVEIDDGGRAFHVQQLVEGHTLDAEIMSGPVSAERVARMGAAICSALAAAHDAGVAHRAIDGSRVILTTTPPFLALIDFGLPDHEHDDDGDDHHAKPRDIRAVGELMFDALASGAVPIELAACLSACRAVDDAALPTAGVLATQLADVAELLGADSLDGGRETGSFSRLLRDVAHAPVLAPSHGTSATIKSDRFEVRKKLGQGGFGVVYEAFDKTRDALVALKALERVDGEKLYRFKKEFRALSGLVHPNLVRLYELVAVDGDWFFTMELVAGTDFVSFVRSSPADLRRCLSQLVDGVEAIHAAGRLHRDLKPHNVLVTTSGAVKILDFGLVAELNPDDRQTAEAAGTPAYIAPETIGGEAPTQATDWYSFGAMLYEALTGSIPFGGAGKKNVLVEKLIGEPADVRAIVPDAPADLAELTRALLQRDMALRPNAAAIRAAIHGGAAPGSPVPAVSMNAAAEPRFHGRVDELAILRQALADSRRAPVVIVIEGESGIGKTALARRFLSDTRAHAGACVLSGRCYEREAVPYKAFDGVIDSLSRHLRALPSSEIASVFPRRRDAAMLARLFPVLERVPAWPTSADVDLSAVHPQELRARAFTALRELLTRLAERGPVAVSIDDIQWADADSHALLRELALPPEPPAFLLLCTARPGRVTVAQEPRRILLAGLGPDDVTAMAGALGMHGTDVDQIVTEARGHPLFVQELLMSGQGDDPHAARLDDVLWGRIGRLPAPQRSILELVALAGAPLGVSVLAEAAGLAPSSVVDSAGALCSARLARAADIADAFEPYHDRVREVLVTRMPEGQRVRGHTTLADTLERRDLKGASLSEVVRHLQAAELTQRACALAPRVARQAEAALAFERAAELYDLATELSGISKDERHDLVVKAADALSHAGRGLAAADKYLQAATTADDSTRLRLESRAAIELLGSGRAVEGEALLAKVCRALGEPWPTTTAGAAWALISARVRLRLRGLSYRARDPALLPPRDRLRLELHESLSSFLPIIEPLRGLALGTRALLFALDRGAETFIAIAFCREAQFRAVEGATDLANALAEKAEELAARAPRPGLRASMDSFRSGALVPLGRFAEGVDLLGESVRALADASASSWPITVARLTRLAGLEQMGAYADFSEEFDVALSDARRRNDRLLEERLVALVGTRWLIEDRPDEATRQLSAWPKASGLGARHVAGTATVCELNVALYNAAVPSVGDDAWRRLAVLERTAFFLRFEVWRVHVVWLRARLHLARGHAGLKVIRRLAASLRSERAAHATWKALLIEAGIAATTGANDESVALLRAAEAAAEDNRCPFFAAIARRRRGELTGGETGLALIAAADAELSRTVRAPSKFADMYAPGFSRR